MAFIIPSMLSHWIGSTCESNTHTSKRSVSGGRDTLRVRSASVNCCTYPTDDCSLPCGLFGDGLDQLWTDLVHLLPTLRYLCHQFFHIV